MRLYYVEPPPEEDEGEGLDRREWFGNLAEATKRFNHWVRECRKSQAATASGDPDQVEAARQFKFDRVVLASVNVPTDKAGLLQYLNQRFPAGEVVKEFG